MKTLIFKYLIALSGLVLFVNVNAQKTFYKSKLEKINLKRIESTKVDREKVEKETKIIRAKYDEVFYSQKFKSPDSIAVEYLMMRHSSYGINKDEGEVRIKKISTTPGGKYVYYEQYLNNFPIYSTTGLIALNKGDSVTYTLNNIRDIKIYKY